MATEFLKDKDATLDYSFDWTDWLTGAEIIASAAFTVDSGITLSTSSNTTTKTTVWLSGGTVGQSYRVVHGVTTNSSPARVDQRTMIITIVER